MVKERVASQAPKDILANCILFKKLIDAKMQVQVQGNRLYIFSQDLQLKENSLSFFSELVRKSQFIK
jgi:hypothetical protein